MLPELYCWQQLLQVRRYQDLKEVEHYIYRASPSAVNRFQRQFLARLNIKIKSVSLQNLCNELYFNYFKELLVILVDSSEF